MTIAPDKSARLDAHPPPPLPPHSTHHAHHLAHHRVRHALPSHASYHSRRAPSANRGIGLELVRQLSQDADNLVIATARDPTKATELEKIKAASKAAFHVVPLDVASEASIHAVVPHVESALGAHGLDYLVNNAAAVRAPPSPFTTQR
jgi:hypothetical protein